MAVDREKLKQEILEKVRQYHALAHTPAAFEPGKSRVTYAGRYYDQKELVNLVDASLDFWLTAGPYSSRFEAAMRRRFKASAFFFVNSGSSANLLMVSTLCSPDLERYLAPRDPRSLAPGEPDYKPHYDGDLRARDAAYHQGSVWAWLIGPYIDALARVYPARCSPDLLQGFVTHLDQACIGSISEIFDGERPHTPRACIAQAWSVAEVLRCLAKTEMGCKPAAA